MDNLFALVEVTAIWLRVQALAVGSPVRLFACSPRSSASGRACPLLCDPVARLRDDLNEDCRPSSRCGAIDRGGDFFDVGGCSQLGTWPCLAAEIPEIHALGQCFPAFAFQVLADFVLDAFDHPGRLVGWFFKGERFLHDLMSPPSADLSRGIFRSKHLLWNQ